MPSSIAKKRQPKNQFPKTPPTQQQYDDEEDIFKEEEGSDISDTELQLVKILNTFTKGKGKENGGLSIKEFDAIDKALPWVNDTTQVRLKRLAKENIRLISSEMTAYLLCHEFKGMFERKHWQCMHETYIVRVGPRVDCTCRDWMVRKTHCKHILFVLLEEIKVTDLTNRIYQTLYPTNELLREIYTGYHPTL